VLDIKTKLMLAIYLSSFVSMIIGIVFFNWWTLEMSALFLGAAILVAIITRMNERNSSLNLLKAQKSAWVALIIGVARGVTIVFE